MSSEVQVVEALLEKLRDSDWSVRQDASKQLQSVNDASALPILNKATQDDDLSVRVAAVSCLSNFELELVQATLEKTLFDAEWEVQWASLRALGQLHKEPALRHMGDRLPEKRIAGIQNLVKKRARHFVLPLCASLDDECEDVQIAGVRAIMELHLKEAIEPLQAHIAKASPELRAWFAEALLLLGGLRLSQGQGPDTTPLHLLPCHECQHLLPPSQLHKVRTWNKEAKLLCQFHFEDCVEQIEPFEGKLKRCKLCLTHWPKYEFTDGSCPSCRKQRYEHLAPLNHDDQFRCFRCHKTFPSRNVSPASQPNEPLCSRCAYNVARLTAKQPFLSERTIHFLSEAFENGFFLCEQSRHFYPLKEMAEGEDFRDRCVSKDYSKTQSK